MIILKKKKIALLCSLIIFTLIILATNNSVNDTIEIDDIEYRNLRGSKSSNPIHIDGNQGWVAFKNDGNCTGFGNYTDPYVIEDLDIDVVDQYETGISIENTNVFFIIKNCTIYHSGSYWPDCLGIELFNVSNGLIFNNSLNSFGWHIFVENSRFNNISENEMTIGPNTGITLKSSHNNTVFKNVITVLSEGILLWGGNNNTIIGNEISEVAGITIQGHGNSIILNKILPPGPYSINIFTGYKFNRVFCNYIGFVARDDGTNNNWDDSFAGNYWVGFSGSDINPKDGIYDSKYTIPGSANSNDTKPLVYSPNLDSDGDGLQNFEEYTLGKDGYRTNVTTPDSEYDNITDYWEWVNGTNPWNNDTDYDLISDYYEIEGILGYITNATNSDTDYDNLRDDHEYGNNTNPIDSDTDNDLLLDGDEIKGTWGYLTNASNPDTDYDGLRDDFEYGNFTNPLEPDTDFDTIWDINEILGFSGFVTNASNPDTDYDGLRDDFEYGNNTNPLEPDTDFDTIWDTDEILGTLGFITNASNPDTDYDGLRDDFEYGNFTNPLEPDTDFDTIWDINEILGISGFVTNASNPDTDYDGLRDDFEYGNNTNPLEPDTDGDTLLDGDEILGTLGYITNATNPDTDYDNLRDNYEYNYNTNPLDPDTDNDSLLDGDEISGVLGYITNATIADTDSDGLKDGDEYNHNTNPLDPDSDNDNVLDGEELTFGLDGYITNATNSDTDSDSYDDGVEFNLGTNPNDALWYPMPNLNVLNFTVSDVFEGQPFVLDFTIINDGIWDANGIIVIIRCEALDLTLYNNTIEPFNLNVDQVKHIVYDCSEITIPGVYALTISIDPDSLINETYSSKDGSYRVFWSDDNNEQIQMQIIAVEGGGTDGFSFELLILIIIGIIAGTVSIIGSIVIKRRYNQRRDIKANELKAKYDIEEFEQKLHVFIRSRLKDNYKDDWWEKGIPPFIRSTIEPNVKTKLLKNRKLSLDGVDFLEFSHYFSVISEKNNWDNIFSNTFSLIQNIEEPFENLKVFKNKLYQKKVNMREYAKYPAYIFAITKYFKKEINIFLSYSTLDTKHFNISEISKSLENNPEINKIFYWEVDSGEDIVDYMERTLNLSNIFILFCTENSIKSHSVEDEWKAAFQLRKKGLKKIIPVYEEDSFIPTLLTPLLNVKFDKNNFEDFIQNLYNEILRS